MKKEILLSCFIFCTVILKAQFTVYNTANSGIGANNCYCINLNAANEVWVSTQTDGANVFNGNSWTHYNTSNTSLQSDYLTSVFFDQAGNTWTGSYSGTGGLSKYNGSTWTVYTSANSGLTGNDITDITADNSGRIWIATRFNGVCVFDGSSWLVYNTGNSLLLDNQIYSIEADPSGNIWIGSAAAGLYKYNGISWTAYNTTNSNIPGNNIYSLKYNSTSNTLWVGTSNGLGVLNVAGSAWTVYTTANSGISSDYIRDVSFSPVTGDTWIATGFNGISKLSGTTWSIYNMANSNIPSNGIWAIKTTANGNVWAATWGGGIVTINEKPTAINKQKGLQHQVFNLYPNPNNGSFTLNNTSFNNYTLNVADLLGRIIHTQEIYPGTNQVHSKIIGSGVYSYSITDNTGQTNRGKFITR